MSYKKKPVMPEKQPQRKVTLLKVMGVVIVIGVILTILMRHFIH